MSVIVGYCWGQRVPSYKPCSVKDVALLGTPSIYHTNVCRGGSVPNNVLSLDIYRL